jgi:hypothetical protein
LGRGKIHSLSFLISPLVSLTLGQPSPRIGTPSECQLLVLTGSRLQIYGNRKPRRLTGRASEALAKCSPAINAESVCYRHRVVVDAVQKPDMDAAPFLPAFGAVNHFMDDGG